MKTTLTLIAITLLSSAMAGDLPLELEILTGRYEGEKSRALAPIELSYDRELSRLKDRYTKAGNLDAAIAVDRVLKSREPKAAKEPEPSIIERVAGDDSVWIWQSGGELTLKKNGSASHSSWRIAAKWKKVADGKLSLSRDDGREFTVEFSDENNAVVTAAEGGQSKLTRK